MASAAAARRLGVQLVRHSFRTRPNSTIIPFRPVGQAAPFHRSPYRRDGDKSGNTKTQTASTGSGVTPDSDEATSAAIEATEDDGIEKEGFLQFPVGTSPEAKEEALRKWDELLADPPPEAAGEIREFKAMMQGMEQEVEGEVSMGPDDELEISDDFLEMKPEYGIFAEGEEYPEEEGEDDKFEGDDITSLAHGELERHREIREYMRLAAYELPLLSKYAKEFVLPGKDRPLRFRHTTYLGEKHPARHKVVLEFCTADLPLEPAQRLKLVKLVGQRYDPQTDTVKMACEQYENAAQNKRYLGDLVKSLIKEARNQSDAEGGKDAFDDVPVDFRHVRWQKRHAFPDHWSLTPEKQAALRRARGERAADELRRRQQGQIASGEAAIEAAQRAEQAAAYETAHPVGARRPVATLRR